MGEEEGVKKGEGEKGQKSLWKGERGERIGEEERGEEVKIQKKQGGRRWER
jgi:hypothetical protein